MESELPEGWQGPVVELNNWCCSYLYDMPFIPPEVNLTVLIGEVKGHPRKSDGKRVRTTPVLDSCGIFVKTENTVYKLGNPEKEYLDWLNKNNRLFDPENPIKFVDD